MVFDGDFGGPDFDGPFNGAATAGGGEMMDESESGETDATAAGVAAETAALVVNDGADGIDTMGI